MLLIRNSLHRVFVFEKKLHSLHLVSFQPGLLVAVIDMLALASNEGEEQNREEGEMTQKTLGGGRNRGKR